MNRRPERRDASHQVRLALVFGNTEYKACPRLKNAQNDGQDMAGVLTGFDFEVILVIDANLTVMRRKVREFALLVKTHRPCTAVFYFAGHGVELEGKNFLIPVEFLPLEDPNDEMGDVALELKKDLYERLNAPGIRHPQSLVIILLDCCRENDKNPDTTFRHSVSTSRSVYGGKEFGLFRNGSPPISAPNSSQFLTAYGSAPGNVTIEYESERNGVFTQAILQELGTAGACEPLQELIMNVAARVRERSAGKQRPWSELGGLEDDFYFSASTADNRNRIDAQSNNPPAVDERHRQTPLATRRRKRSKTPTKHAFPQASNEDEGQARAYPYPYTNLEKLGIRLLKSFVIWTVYLLLFTWLFQVPQTGAFVYRLFHSQDGVIITYRHAWREQPVCAITDFDAIADNKTLNTLQIQRAIDHCADHYPNGSTVLVPEGAYRTGSISLRSNMRFHIKKGAGLYGSNDPIDYAPSFQWSDGRSVKTMQPLIGGTNLINVSITGESEPNAYRNPNSTSMTSEASIVDGVGWSWWCRANCMPRTKRENQLRCDHFNPNNDTLPSELRPDLGGQGRPVLIGFQNCTDVLVSYIIAQNSPYWVVNIEKSSELSIQVNVRSPRSVGYPGGIDPTSCVELFAEPPHANFSTRSDTYNCSTNDCSRSTEAESDTVLWDISTRRPGRAYVDLGAFFVWRHVCSSAGAFLLLVVIKAEWTASPCPLRNLFSDQVDTLIWGSIFSFGDDGLGRGKFIQFSKSMRCNVHRGPRSILGACA
jgi:uncharacterized caspase-like protein